jgi:hypothetical protein
VVINALWERGLWPVDPGEYAEAAPDPTDLAAMEAALRERLLKIDAELVEHLERTRVDRYLSNRGITIRPTPQQIGYHPSLYHPWSGESWPAMVAAMRDVTGKVAAFHRTWLTFAEPITKVPLDPVRAHVGSWKGLAVQLAPAAETLCIGEGIETTLAGMELYGLPGWATTTAGNVPELPPLVRSVLILADNDETGLDSAIKAAWQYQREGRAVQIVTPDECNDLNDFLQLTQATQVDSRRRA